MINNITLHQGDCLEVIPTLSENSIDAVVTDPPYHLTSIVKRFSGKGASPAKFGKDGVFIRSSTGFMGKEWDGGDIAFRPETWAKVYRVLKPGAYLVAFGGSRTYHRLACAIEDAGFIIHPLLGWIFGQGFPKAHSVSKHIDRMSGAKRSVVGKRPNVHSRGFHKLNDGWRRPWMDDPEAVESSMLETAPATDAAKQWDGWFYGGQTLKPALEPVCFAQKPFEKGLNGTQNVLKWGTGALNIDGCRIATDEFLDGGGEVDKSDYSTVTLPSTPVRGRTGGRWPANVAHDGSDEVISEFPGARSAGNYPSDSIGTGNGATYLPQKGQGQLYDDSGSAARFFFQAKRFHYSSKADSDDRLGSNHPTIKPVDLIQWLCRMVTPPNGLILDPFAGSGTTGEAAIREGFGAVLIEREKEYCTDILRRMQLAVSGPNERKRESIKARGLTSNAGPLFEGIE